MSATMEALPSKAQGVRSSSLRKPLSLRMRDARMLVEPDGSVRSFDSLSERRAIFGFERVQLYKVQAGVVVQAQRSEWSIRVTPRAVFFTSKVFDVVEVGQSLEFFQGTSSGYVRRLKLRNSGTAGVKMRAVEVLDPTAAHFGESDGRWGALGVNAFNRDSHIAMDEVSDPPSARVVGAVPSPSKFYMTTDKAKAIELLASGELPDPTAGMSGQVLVLSVHDLDLAPGETREISFSSLYSPQRLEDGLSDFSRFQRGDKPTKSKGPTIACSSSSLTEAASWALPLVESVQFGGDALDRFESLRALAFIDPSSARTMVDSVGKAARKDGSIPHAMDPSRPGVLETALLLRGISAFLVMSQEKKMTRAHYPTVKKLAGYLLMVSKDYSVQPDSALPQGWRRHLGRGFPTGQIPEVSLAVAGALAAAAQVAKQVSKASDTGALKERAEMVAEHVRKRLLDERGYLCLCLDSSGKLRTDETADMAVAAYRHPFYPAAEQAAAHRLMEKDFETPYGPRCVPTSNQVYFNESYGRGQLGAVWTRAALAHAILCYRVGLSGIGSLALQKIARLVVEDSVKFGNAPGEFPLWVDFSESRAHSDDGDVVSAARLVEALFECETGMTFSSEKVSLSPPASSSLTWVLLGDIWLGEPATMFAGRAGGKVHTFLAAGRAEARQGMKFSKSEILETGVKGVYALSMYGPGQVICLASNSPNQTRVTLNFAPRGAELSKRLATPLEAFDPTKGTWSKVGSVRVLSTMSFEATLGPNEWKAFRVSTT